MAHAPWGTEIEGARVLDLFAGTGALAIEALSRGATFALFVEQDVKARALIRRNIEALELTGATRIFRRDATHLGPIGTMAPFSVVFLDPPYGRNLGVKALSALAEGDWLEPGATLVVEESTDAKVEPPNEFEIKDHRTYGDTQVLFLNFKIADRSDAGSAPDP